MIKNLKTSKGITLIALVVTIIVLLILAGVAISMLSGENGILRQAANAKTETDRTSTEEAIKLAVTAAITNKEHRIESEDALKEQLDDQFGEDGYDITGDIESGWTVTANGVTQIIASSGSLRDQNDIEKLISSEEPIKQEKVILEDEEDHIITIPQNFNMASESPSLVTKGMIIEDSENNQYVWIPVFSNEEYSWGVDWTATKTAEETYKNDNSEANKTAYYTAIETALKTYTSTYKNTSYTDVWYGDASYGKYGYYNGTEFIYYTNGDMTEDDYNDLYHNMLDSVYKNGGFYIGRYEMGIDVVESTTEAQEITRVKMDEYKASTATNTSTTTVSNGAPSIEGMTAPVSKANAVAYTYITQSQAQMLAEELGKKSDYNKVESSIMFGVQWDMVCVFIENFDENNTAPTGSKSQWLKSSNYGKLWGNYENASFTLNQGYYTTTYGSSTVTWNQNYTTAKGTSTKWLCTTGASNQNSSLNIYDFGGNLAEWTLERSSNSSKPCVYRGHYFNFSSYASGRSSNYTSVSYYYNSSRASLYMK